MPEGDTVWRQARLLRDALVGLELTSTDFRVPRFATIDLSGRVVDSVDSRGKHLLVRAGDAVIHSHLKMEGIWDVYPAGARWRKPAWKARVILRNEQVDTVGFELGKLEVIARDDEHDALGYLGPDLLGPDWDAAEAVTRLGASPEAEVIVALAEQRNLAGLGNVYVNELCFLRGIRPDRPVADVDLPALVDLARRVIVANRDRPERVTTGDLRRGRRLWVYGRGGEACLRCGTTIQRGEFGRSALELRVTYWCPSCQT